METTHKFNRQYNFEINDSLNPSIIWHQMSHENIIQPEFRYSNSSVNSHELFYLQLKEKLNSFYEINDNWDNEGSAGIDETAIGVAHKILNELKEKEFIENQIAIHLFPTYESGIQFELDSNELRADIEIHSCGQIEYTIYSPEGSILKNESFTSSSIAYCISQIEEQLFDYAY